MSVFQCIEPVERQEEIAPLLLNFQRYDDYHSKEQVLRPNLAGGLIIQNTLWFHKPHKVIVMTKT